MKSTNCFYTLAIAVVLLLCTGCPRGNTGNKFEQEPEIPKFQYVEPTENIAKIIWERISVENPEIKCLLEKSKKYEGYRGTKPEPQYQSKTRMVYFNTGYEFDGYLDERVFYYMQCYQMKDQSWIALVYDNSENQGEDDPRHSGFGYYHYKDGELVDDTLQVGLPAVPPTSVMNRPQTYYPWSDCAFVFDSVGFEMIADKFWPIRYEWTGEKFVVNPQSIEVSNVLQFDDIYPYDFSRTIKGGLNFPSFKVSPSYLVSNEYTGEKVLQLEFEDGMLSALKFLSPKMGISFKEEWVDYYYRSYRRYPSNPIALGQPIKDVIESEKSKDIYKEITESTKDGMYTITQHIKVDKSIHKDVYAEYQAKDKNSNIESIRFYTQPLTVTLESELEEDKKISDETKQLWAKINADNAITRTIPGPFVEIHPWGTYENGFSAIYRKDYDNGGSQEWWLTFSVLKANDGRQIAYVWKRLYRNYNVDNPQEALPEWQQFVYQDGVLQEVEPQIPMPKVSDFPAYVLGDKALTVDGPRSEMNFSADGEFSFIAHSDNYQDFGDGAPDAYLQFYEIRFYWDGEKFTPYEFDYDEFYRYQNEPKEEYYEEEDDEYEEEEE